MQAGLPPSSSSVVPLEGPGEAEGDVGGTVLQLSSHLFPAGGADAPERARAALDASSHDVLVAVQCDELHGHLVQGGGMDDDRVNPHPRTPLPQGTP